MIDRFLEKFADLAEATAIKANGMTSWFESYQPIEPEAVKNLVSASNQE